MASSFVLAKDLTPKIHHRSIRLRLIRSFLSKGFGTLEKVQNRECLFHDEECTFVHVQIPHEYADKFNKYLHEGQVYEFGEFIVQSNRQSFKTCGHTFLMKVNYNTTLSEYRQDDFPTQLFTLKDFATLKRARGVQADRLIDLIGHVVSIGREKTIFANNRDSRVIDFVIEDTSESRLVVTAWDDHVDSVLPHLNADLQHPLIAIVHMCRARTTPDPRLPFKFQRRQFPLMLAYAMTINKSQGQTLTHVGLLLKKPVFNHGQLYVAFSRVTHPNGLKILALDDDGRRCSTTSNVVYKEVFNNL